VETKTFKNRFLVVLGVISLLWVTMAVSSPRSNAASAILQSKDAYRDVPLALAFSSREGVSTPYRLANGASSLYSPDHSQQTFVFIHGFGGQAEQ